MKIEGIVTQRLTIRNYKKTDMQFVMSIWNDPEMGKYLPDPVLDDIDEKYLKSLERLEDDNSCCYLISELKQTGERVGTCSFVPSRDGKEYDLAYCVHMKFWGQGYATEMVMGMINYAIEHGAKTITVSVNKQNAASNAIMKKLGFSVVGDGTFKKRGTNLILEDYKYCLDINIGNDDKL